MKLARLIPVAAAAALLAGAAGCGKAKYVKVSGVVTVDGQPYKNAIVSFQPVATAGNEAPGRGSSALTDEKGQYTLVTDDGHKGAVVGKHRVRIQTKRDDPTAYVDPKIGSPDDPTPKGKKTLSDPIPLKWYSDQSNNVYEVPPGGTDKMNFDIRTREK